MSTIVNFSGRDIEVKTLTVRQIADYLDGMKKKDPEVLALDLLFNDDVPANAVCLATGLTPQELSGDVKPSEVRELWDSVRAENPFFVGMMERLVKAGEQMQKPSSAQPAGL